MPHHFEIPSLFGYHDYALQNGVLVDLTFDFFCNGIQKSNSVLITRELYEQAIEWTQDVSDETSLTKYDRTLDFVKQTLQCINLIPCTERTIHPQWVRFMSRHAKPASERHCKIFISYLDQHHPIIIDFAYELEAPHE